MITNNIDSNTTSAFPRFAASITTPTFDSISQTAFSNSFEDEFENSNHYRGVVNTPALFRFIDSRDPSNFDYALYKSNKTVRRTRTRRNYNNSYTLGHKDFGKGSEESYVASVPVSIPVETTINGVSIKIYPGCSLNKKQETIYWDSVKTSIYLNPDKKKISYTLYWTYNNAENEDKGSDFYGDKFGEHSAIALKLANYEEMAATISYLDYNVAQLQQIATEKIDVTLKNIRDNRDANQLEWFYNNVPEFYIKNYISSESLYNDLITLLELDERWFDESDSAIVGVLKGFYIKKDGMKFLYDKFLADGTIIKRIYNQLDGTTTSPIHNNEKVPNKTFFASLLNAICHYNGQGYNNVLPKVKFNVTNGYRINSNAYFSDESPDKFYLAQQVLETKTISKNFGDEIVPDRQQVPVSQWITPPGQEYNLHPLTMVEVVVPGDKNGGGTTILLAAIMIKDLAYHEEWKRISKNIRIGIDVLIIAVSAVVLVSGPGILIATLSIIDLGLASADLVIQTFEEEISKIEGGKEFLDAWEKIYLIGGIVTAAPVVGVMLKNGFKVLAKVTSIEVRQQLVLMLKHALQQSKRFPKFVNGQFEIITNYAKVLGTHAAAKMQLLANEGAFLVRGIKEGGEGVVDYFLVYKDTVLNSGNIRQVAKQITQITRKGKGNIRKYLERLFYTKAGTGGNFKYIEEITSSRILCQEQPQSCAAACIRQIAQDNGKIITEETARIAAKTDGLDLGTDIDKIGPGLQKIFPDADILSGSLFLEGRTTLELIEELASLYKNPWIVTLRPQGGIRHTVIVDKIVDGIVHIRDPWDLNKGYGAKFGTEAKIGIDDFVDLWDAGTNNLTVIK